MDELLGTRVQPERWSRSGSLCAEVGTGRAVSPRPFPRSGCLSPLRFGQFSLTLLFLSAFSQTAEVEVDVPRVMAFLLTGPSLMALAPELAESTRKWAFSRTATTELRTVSLSSTTKIVSSVLLSDVPLSNSDIITRFQRMRLSGQIGSLQESRNSFCPGDFVPARGTKAQ
jgi:hypothetical protein